MIQPLLTNKCRARFSWMMLFILTLQILLPNVAMALSSGPVQPEIQSFEPVGTTDMIDKFTGDFVYNIPLMDVEGYPVNISYHGGVTMEQEASWVGLGWNINPGSVNRALRGLPDEFDGDTVEKEINIKPEITKKFGVVVGAELLGVGDPYLSIGANLGGYLTMSNYRGVSVDFTASAGINTSIYGISAGLNVGASIGSQAGAAINYGASIGLGASQSVSSDLSASGSFNLNSGGNYSPRTGMKQDVGFNTSLSLKQSSGAYGGTLSTGATVPIGVQNYTAAITNSSYMNSYTGQLKLGGELYGIYLTGKVNGTISKLEFEHDGSRKGYGYFNLDKAEKMDLLDFSREKDGMYNTTMHYLPQAHLTYDVYNVNGQGTGGSFRPIRNDIGSVYDPTTSSKQNSESIGIEAGLGNLFEVGGEYTKLETNTESGPWDDYKRPFTGKDSTGAYEDYYFKEAGELTENNADYLNTLGTSQKVKPEEVKDISLTKPGGGKRVTRANYIYALTGKNEDTAAILDTKQLISYEDSTGFKNYPTVSKTSIPRVDAGTNKLKRKANQITEIVQIQKDGRRYVYGLPVMNNVQREVTFAVDTTKPSNHVDLANYLVDYTQGTDDSRSNGNGTDHFYSSTVTPGYVTSNLLTNVLSKDYIDVTGNGISDDDLGTYTKFNYTRKAKDYRWRSPIEPGKAQYIPGFMTDKKDDKAGYIIGSREQWMLHSIETRNYVAEFYVSARNDGRGVLDKILSGSSTSIYNETPYNANPESHDRSSYKLDSIVLYNKQDRFMNGTNAQSIKTVLFSYDYSLCPGVPNTLGDGGKLTLKKIQVKYGSSNLNMSAAYSFSYDEDYNYPYKTVDKDKWGNYKPSDPAFNNYQFPFTKQDPGSNDYAKAWSLSEIKLPSGGVIKVDYEADDYAYVQDLKAMEMFHIVGMGNSAQYSGGNNQLYFSKNQPNLYFYFDRRLTDENSQLSMRENYLVESNLLYYNIPTELKEGAYEPIKGYAEVQEVGACSDGTHGYVKLTAKTLEGTSTSVNPVVFTALNVGRYSLPNVLYPGADPDGTDMQNVVAGLKNSIKELFSIHKNPLEQLIDQGKAQETQLPKSYMRLNSPGLKKKGGGQRVKTVKFYDSWDKMVGGTPAVYGKEYNYTMRREDGKGVISSGVASYEPMTGGDELPQRIPSGYQVQGTNNFPPNDPVELYQEMPIGESFFPGAVVGYRNVTSRSINIDKGRSSQSEDINGFYTARDFPIRTDATSIKQDETKDISLMDVTLTQTATQGFSIVLNDMHGKPRNTEHWVLKTTDTGGNARELVNYQKYEYSTKNGLLNNTVPVFDYNAGAGRMNVTEKKMGTETDMTIDSRMRIENSTMHQFSVSVNGFLIAIVPIVLPIPYWFQYGNVIEFKCASVTKVTQQYGIINKVINNNQGAITELRNEVFDAQTGNALVTSVNNEFGDRTFNVSYPAYWAYKELGLPYENHNTKGVLPNKLYIDTMGTDYGARFINYNPGYSSRYALPAKMLIGRMIVNEKMPIFKLGDELLLRQYPMSVPTRVWVMGYTADNDNCHLIVATREPYKQDDFWRFGNNYSNVQYQVIRSGYSNQLGETIQSYTTKDSSNIFPYLKDTLTNLISLNAVRYNHNLNQVFAANTTSDSLNPFVTGKVGTYRPELQVVNLKKRDYIGGTTRNAGVFNSAAYWKVEKDNFNTYCDNLCEKIFDSLRLDYLGGDSMRLSFTPAQNTCNGQQFFKILWRQFAFDDGSWNDPPNGPPTDSVSFAPGISGSFVIHNRLFLDYHFMDNGYGALSFIYGKGCCNAKFSADYHQSQSQWNDHYDIDIVRDHDYTHSLLNYNAFTTGPYYTTNYPYFAKNSSNVLVGSPSFFDTSNVPLSPWGASLPQIVSKKILLGKVGHYDSTDNENWVNTQQVTKYNWYGAELENKDYTETIGSGQASYGYNAAIYGYNQQQPICVVKNGRHSEVLYEPFEDYHELQPKPDIRESYMPLFYSPFVPFLQAFTALGTSYKTASLTAPGGAFVINKEQAHTGYYSIKNDEDVYIPMNGVGAGMANGYSFKVKPGQRYVAAVWLRPTSASGNEVLKGYSGNVAITMDTTMSTTPSSMLMVQSLTPKSGIIEGWQQYELVFEAPTAYKNYKLKLGGRFYYDDLRIYPTESNSKGFVYHPVTRKLMATLDENNYATFFEYDQEGNLVRTKKETDRGVLTITESRSTHYKAN